MAHKTRINGTNYEIIGGKTLVGGTAYGIKNGKTLVGGTAYEVGLVREGVSSSGEILDDWATIASLKNIGLYSVGNYKPVTLTDGTTFNMKIVAFNADTKQDGSKAAISWISEKIITSRVMNSTNTNANGWKATELRAWLQSDFYATLPAEVRNIILSVNKTYYDLTTTSTLSCLDNVWIPSQYEIFGANSCEYGCESTGVSYLAAFPDATSRTKYKLGGAAASWRLRTTHKYNNCFRGIRSNGSGYDASTASTCGVAIGFCT